MPAITSVLVFLCKRRALLSIIPIISIGRHSSPVCGTSSRFIGIPTLKIIELLSHYTKHIFEFSVLSSLAVHKNSSSFIAAFYRVNDKENVFIFLCLVPLFSFFEIVQSSFQMNWPHSLRQQLHKSFLIDIYKFPSIYIRQSWSFQVNHTTMLESNENKKGEKKIQFMRVLYNCVFTCRKWMCGFLSCRLFFVN